MTKKELIESLKDFDDNAEVMVYDYCPFSGEVDHLPVMLVTASEDSTKIYLENN